MQLGIYSVNNLSVSSMSFSISGRIFSTELGTPLEGRNITRTLHRVLKEAGIEQLGVDALRHTFATRAMEAGMDLRRLERVLVCRFHRSVAATSTF